jgi:hypothetical protein
MMKTSGARIIRTPVAENGRKTARVIADDMESVRHAERLVREFLQPLTAGNKNEKDGLEMLTKVTTITGQLQLLVLQTTKLDLSM